MTKADIVSQIADQTGMEKHDVQITVEAFMRTVRDNVERGDNVYLRGFGSFIVKTRATKTGRNILARSLFLSLLTTFQRSSLQRNSLKTLRKRLL